MMMKLSTAALVLFTAFLATSCVPDKPVAAPASSEQLSAGGEAPLMCQYNRGAWCITGGLPEIAESTNKSRIIWRFYRSYWEGNPGYIIDPATCKNVKSDTVEFIERRSDYEFRGGLWKTSVIRLHSSGKCDLRLIVPRGPSRGSAAERYLPAKISICNGNADCAYNTLYKAISGRQFEIF